MAASATRKKAPRLPDEELGRTARAGRRRRQRGAEADRPRGGSALSCRSARHGPPRGAAPAGVLLRHTGSGALREGRRRPCPPRAEEGRRLGREAATGGAVASRREPAAVSQHGRRGGRDAGRFRVLGVPEAHPRHARGESGRQGRAQAAQAVLEGAARLLRRARARRESSSTTSRSWARSTS